MLFENIKAAGIKANELNDVIRMMRKKYKDKLITTENATMNTLDKAAFTQKAENAINKLILLGIELKEIRDATEPIEESV